MQVGVDEFDYLLLFILKIFRVLFVLHARFT